MEPVRFNRERDLAHMPPARYKGGWFTPLESVDVEIASTVPDLRPKADGETVWAKVLAARNGKTK